MTRRNAVVQGEKLPADRPKVLLREITGAVLQDYQKNKRATKHLECRLKHILPFFGQMKANDVGTTDIDSYIEKRQAEGAENATINRELSALRRAYTLAFNSKPRRVDDIPKVAKLEENAAREGFVEDEQFAALKEAANEAWLRAVLVTAYTFGFRRNELLGLKVSQVNLLRRTIRLAAISTKNKTPRTIKMTKEVLNLVKECIKGKAPHDYVFTRGSERIKDFRGAWWALCEAAGLGKFKDKKWTGLLFHDLRRSAVRNLVASGVNEKTAMTVSGHKSRSVFDRYQIVSERDLEEVADKLEKRTESKTEVETSEDLAKATKAA
jgi:integrase